MIGAVAFWRSLAFSLATVAVCVPRAGAQAVPLAERIEQCGGCHGADGNSPIEKIPSLAGQPEFFLLNQLFLMREGVRLIEPMTPFVKSLADGEMAALAKHYAGLQPKLTGAGPDPAVLARGAELAAARRCASCHLPSLAGQEQMPRLAKQRIDYLIHALTDIRDSRRSGADTVMSASVVALSDADLAALANYAASK
ncbi:MAG: c-type cytochrome [Proteobacteria bacterium]|nr:c-type cytochrome [Pseudomonadota bacterium]